MTQRQRRLAPFAVRSLVLRSWAVAAIAGFAVKSIKSLLDTELALRPLIERSRLAAESLQTLAEVAVRAGSEDGLEAIVDTSQELQLQLGEIALAGNSRAVACPSIART